MYLRHRVQLIFVLLSLLVVTDVALDRYLVVERDSLRREVRRRWEPARTAAADVLVGLVDQETGQRGYLITGDEEFLDPYLDGGNRVDAALARLQELVGDDPDIEARLRRAGDRISAWRQLGAVFEIEARRAEETAEVRALVATGTSRQLFEEARLDVDGLRDGIIARLGDQERSVDRLEGRISRLRIASAILALAIVVAGSVLLRRWLSRPLRQLTDAAQIIAGGDLDLEIPAPGPPELAGLGRDVEAMRRRILDEADSAARALSSLAQRGMIVLTLRDELAPAAVDLPPAVRVATRFQPAETFVAGDWYDIRRRGEDGMLFVVADVSGHGPDAGIFALKTKQLVGVALDQDLGPAAAWAWVAERLGDTGDQFLTGVIGSVDVGAGCLTYASAGHPPLLLRAGGETRHLGPTGPIVGAVPGIWAEERVDLAGASCIVAYTDGLLEVQDARGDWADLDGLAARLDGTPDGDVEHLADQCLDFHARFDGPERSDDVTVVVVGLG